MACAQVGREIGGWVNQFSKIDDVINARFFGGMSKVARHLQVALGVQLAALFSMNEIVGCGHAMHYFSKPFL